MKSKDIQALSVNELKDKIKEEKANLNKLKLNHAISNVENPLSIRSNRRNIARLATELTKKAKASK